MHEFFFLRVSIKITFSAYYEIFQLHGAFLGSCAITPQNEMHLVEFKSAFLRTIALGGEEEINLLLPVHAKIHLQFNRF